MGRWSWFQSGSPTAQTIGGFIPTSPEKPGTLPRSLKEFQSLAAALIAIGCRGEDSNQLLLFLFTLTHGIRFTEVGGNEAKNHNCSAGILLYPDSMAKKLFTITLVAVALALLPSCSST